MSSQPTLLVEQTTSVVDPLAVTVEEMATIAKAEEEVLVLEEPAVIKDIDLANTVSVIPEVSEEHTPTLEFDEAMKCDTDTYSYVSIEPYMTQGAEYGVVDEPTPEPTLEETGKLSIS